MTFVLLAAAAACVPVLVLVGIEALRSPMRVLLPLYALLIPFGSGIILPIGIPNPFNSLTTLVGLALVVALGVRVVLGREGAPIRSEVIAWILFTAVNGLTFLWSIDKGNTADEFVILVSLLLLYVLVSLVPVTAADVSRLRTGIIVGGTIACGYGFFLLLTGGLPEEKAGLPRFATAGGAGDASDPNITAATLILPIVLALSAAMRATKLSVRLASVAATALMTVGLLLTASRGGALAATIAVAIVIGHQRRPARLAAVVVGGLVAVIVGTAILAPAQFERLQMTGSSGRTNIYEVGRAACAERCLWGSGLNTFAEVHQEAFLRVPGAVGVRIDEPPHNIWLGVAIELGTAGILTLAVAVALTVRSLRRLPRGVRAAPLASLIGLLVTNMFLGNLYFKYFWLVLIYALVEVSAHPDAMGDERPRPALPARRLLEVAR